MLLKGTAALLLLEVVHAQNNGIWAFGQGLFRFDPLASIRQGGQTRRVYNPPRPEPFDLAPQITGWSEDCTKTWECNGTVTEVEPIPIDATGATCYINPLKSAKDQVMWYAPLPYGEDDHIFAWIYTIVEAEAAEYWPDCDDNGECDCAKFEPLREGWDNITYREDIYNYCKFPVSTCSYWNTYSYEQDQCNVNFYIDVTLSATGTIRSCAAGASIEFLPTPSPTRTPGSPTGAPSQPIPIFTLSPQTPSPTPTNDGADPPATDPPATDPPATDPPATDPPATDPPVTDPPATDPPATDPPATDPPATDPPATEPPATDPPATDPPATEPPATDPPATGPPATDPPATEPPATEPPATEAPAPAPVTLEVNPWTIQAYEDETANVGDTVTFTWNGEHSVYIHPTGTCDETGAVQVGVTSPASYTFTEAGEFYFACDVGEHCENGQSIKFTVSDSPAATEPPATEPPATDPPATDSPGTPATENPVTGAPGLTPGPSSDSFTSAFTNTPTITASPTSEPVPTVTTDMPTSMDDSNTTTSGPTVTAMPTATATPSSAPTETASPTVTAIPTTNTAAPTLVNGTIPPLSQIVGDPSGVVSLSAVSNLCMAIMTAMTCLYF